MKEIEEFVLQQFREARDQFLSVHTMDIRRWALIKAREYSGFNFKACNRWINVFKRRNRISSRRIQKLVKRSTVKNIDQLISESNKFRDDVKVMLHRYEPGCVWNTDQTGFKYEIVSNRTLTWKGARTTIGTAYSPKNKLTHSYTVQYVISYDGSIIDKLYVCLQVICTFPVNYFICLNMVYLYLIGTVRKVWSNGRKNFIFSPKFDHICK